MTDLKSMNLAEMTAFFKELVYKQYSRIEIYDAVVFVRRIKRRHNDNSVKIDRF